MFGFIEYILEVFGFTEYQATLAIVSVIIVLGNLLGGLLHNMVRAMAGPWKERKLTQRISFRLWLSSELFMAIFAVYYHAILIQTATAAHVIYWIFTALMAPVLAIVGSQITYLVYAKKIEANKATYREQATPQRHAHAAE